MSRRLAPAPRRRPAGFTLLEILVAMALLAVVLSFSVSTLFVNLRGWNTLAGQNAAMFDAQRSTDWLLGMLRQAEPMVWRVEQRTRLAFSGQPERLHFISRAPLQVRDGAYFEYLLTVEPGADGRVDLVLQFAPYLPGADAFQLPGPGGRRVLLAGLGQVRFDYFGVPRDAREAQWTEQWADDERGYPSLVRIRLAGPGDAPPVAERFVPLLFEPRERL
jgi:prepilin-type N-terminal cleavage/methylation domain-containing protein